MPDEMFFFGNGRGLKRGRRREKRTPTCRPCIVWETAFADRQYEGVVLDVNAHGMLIRMIDIYDHDVHVTIQMMLDDTFQTPLADAFQGRVVRRVEKDGFVDHGIRLDRPDLKHAETPRVMPVVRAASRPTRRTRMHTVDIRLGNTRQR
jgi:hypothetical protein